METLETTVKADEGIQVNALLCGPLAQAFELLLSDSGLMNKSELARTLFKEALEARGYLRVRKTARAGFPRVYAKTAKK